jgi:hypothetical protein
MKTLAILLPMLAAAGVAQAQEPRFTARVQGLWTSFSRDDRYSYFDFVTSTRTEGTTGIGASVELRPSRRFGLEIAAIQSRLDQHETGGYQPPASGPTFESDRSIRLRIATVGLAFHPLPERRGDLYFGPVVGKTFYGPANGTTQDQEAYGGVVGLDWPVAPSWAVGGSVRYLEGKLAGFGVRDGDRRLPIWYAGLGVSYRR